MVRAAFAVAETGSICLPDANLGVNALRYLSQHLIVLALRRTGFHLCCPRSTVSPDIAATMFLECSVEALDKAALRSTLEATPGSQAVDISAQCSNPDSEWNSDRLCASPSGMNSCIRWASALPRVGQIPAQRPARRPGFVRNPSTINRVFPSRNRAEAGRG